MPPLPRRPLPPFLTSTPFTVAQGLSVGVGRGRLRGRDLDRPFRGIREVRCVEPDALYGAISGDRRGAEIATTLSRRCHALLVAMPQGTFFSHLTAARLWPLALPRPDPGENVHVSVRKPAYPSRRSGVVGHRLGDPLLTVVYRNGLPLVDPATLFCQLASMLSLPNLVAVGDALVLQPVFEDWSDDRPWVTAQQLEERVGRFGGRGKVAAAKAVKLIRPGAESRPESLLRLAILEAGLPEPEVNVPVLDAAGLFIGRGDLVYRRWNVVVEYDGEQHRTDNRQFERDVGRLDDFAASGWRVVRITARTCADRLVTIDRSARALVAGGWEP